MSEVTAGLTELPNLAKNMKEEVEVRDRLPTIVKEPNSSESTGMMSNNSKYGPCAGILLMALPLELLRIIFGILGNVKDLCRFDRAITSSTQFNLQWRRFLQDLRSPALNNLTYTNIASVRWLLSRGVDLRNFQVVLSATEYKSLDSTFRDELCKTRGMKIKVRDMTYWEMDALWESLSNDHMDARVDSYFNLLFERQQLAKRFDKHAHLGCEGSYEEEVLRDIISDEDDNDDDDDDYGRSQRMFERVYCNFLDAQMIYWPRGSCKFCDACMAHFPDHDDSYISYWPPRKYLYKTSKSQSWIEAYGACKDCDSNKEWMRTRSGDY